MKKFKNTSKITTISLILILTFTTTFIALPLANAHTPAWNIATFAFINIAPDPVGINQQVSVLIWLDKVISGASDLNDIRFHNYNLTITKPDGSVIETIYPVCEDTTSALFTSYVPDQIGTYIFNFDFPGQIYTWPGAYQNDTYMPSSASTTLTVQEEQITAITSYPLPTEYWTRPIYGENTDWWAISSNWKGTGSPEFKTENFGHNAYVPGAVGSKTSHIMWTKPLQSGGVVGGVTETLGDTYFEGTAYLQRFTNPIIVAGKLYYTEPISYAGSSAGPTVCIDLRTGEEIWSRTDVPRPSFAYIYDYDDLNYHGVWQPILIATGGRGSTIPSGQWSGYDADTGTWLFNITNVPSGATALGSRGEYIIYVIQNAGTNENPDYRLCQWNSFNLGAGIGSIMSNGAISGVIDGSTSNRYDWNISIPWLNTMTSPHTVVAAYYDDIMLCYNGSLPSGGAAAAFGRSPSTTPYTYFAVNLDESKGSVGSVLWWNTLNAPPGNITVFVSGTDPTTGVFIEEYKESIKWVGYDLRTGHKLWGPLGDQASFDYYGNDFGGVMNGQLAYGRLYSTGFSGITYCYNATTGDLLWTYGNGGEGNSTSGGYQLAYGTYPYGIYAIGDGVVYIEVIEHTVNTPIYKGARARALDAFTGEELWTLSDYASSWSYAIADGYSTFMNGYDDQVYCVGKGPSAITASIKNEVVTLGSSAMISGRVVDTAAGTKQNEQAARFPDGVPAVSEASMANWMEYVYQQKPRPQDTVGVDVRIQVVDPAGNYAWIGTATTDSYGNYAYSFIPQMEGLYSIIATFDGSDAYWRSETTTYLKVDPAPAAYPSYPGYQGPSASEVANNVVNSLPDNPTADQISQAVISNLPEYPEQQEAPDYTNMFIIVFVLVAIAIVIGLVSLFRKK
ncbi:MAG: PQQ-binding-like beta-propeller repeat protein [Candidatus Bathyarchaeota archaeon]